MTDVSKVSETDRSGLADSGENKRVISLFDWLEPQLVDKKAIKRIKVFRLYTLYTAKKK